MTLPSFPLLEVEEFTVEKVDMVVVGEGKMLICRQCLAHPTSVDLLVRLETSAGVIFVFT